MSETPPRVTYRYVPRCPAAHQPGHYEVLCSNRSYVETKLRFPMVVKAWWAYVKCRALHTRHWVVSPYFDACGPRGRLYDVLCHRCGQATKVHCPADEPLEKVPQDGMSYKKFQAARWPADDKTLFIID